MNIESGNPMEGSHEKKELTFYDKEKARELVYLNFLRGRLEEDETYELLGEIDAFDKALEVGVFRTLNGLSETISDSMEDLESPNWKEELENAFVRIQSLDIKDDGEIKYARSFIAHHLFTLMNRFQESGKSLPDFARVVREWMEEADSVIPDVFEQKGQVIIDKRQPGFRESVEETLKRYEAIERTREALKGHVDGIIFGGSMSYGPFYNIRGDRDETGPSDLDGIVIMRDDEDQIPLGEIFEEDETAQFPLRMEEFRKLYEKGDAQIITQKSRVKGEDFDISIHFFPKSEFEKLIGDDCRETMKQDNDATYLIHDFRSAEFKHPNFNSHNFDGDTLEYETPKAKEVSRGVINDLPGYRMQRGKFFSGVYQNVVSPGFDVWYDRIGDISEQVDNFKQNMIERMEYEKSQGADTNFQQSHIRHKIFSPHFIKQINPKK